MNVPGKAGGEPMSALQLVAASLVWLGGLGFYVWTLLRALAQAQA